MWLRRSSQRVPQPAQDRVQLIRTAHVAGVEAPLAFGEHERVKLLTPDRSVAAGLILEVGLLAVLECAKHDQVTRVLERVQARQLLAQDAGCVVIRQERKKGLVSEA